MSEGKQTRAGTESTAEQDVTPRTGTHRYKKIQHIQPERSLKQCSLERLPRNANSRLILY